MTSATSQALRRTRICAAIAAAISLVASCAARAADFDEDGTGDGDDNCPWVTNADQRDSGSTGSSSPDGRGDPCQCGDVNGDGKARINDLLLLKRARLGAPVELIAPERCNVIGAVDASRRDARGLTPDCQLNDLVVLQRALLGLGPGIDWVCAASVAPADDTEPPQIEIALPADGDRLQVGAADVIFLLEWGPAAAASTGEDLGGDGVVDLWLDAQIEALRELIPSLDMGTTRVALLLWGNSRIVVQPLTSDAEQLFALLDALRQIQPMQAFYSSEASWAVADARGHLFGAAARPEAAPVVVLFSSRDGPTSDVVSSLSAGGAKLHVVHFGSALARSELRDSPAVTGGVLRRAARASDLPGALAGIPIPVSGVPVSASAADRVAIELLSARLSTGAGIQARGPGLSGQIPLNGLSLPATTSLTASALDRGGHAVTAGPVQIHLEAAEHGPEITSLDPASGEPGDVIEIHGRFFGPERSQGASLYGSGRVLSDSEVRIGSGEARVVGASKTLLRVSVPPGAGSGPMTVRVAGRISNAVEFSIDRDADGLSDERELSLGSDPALADSDGDGLEDGAEVLDHGSSPTSLDSDGDGIGDSAEVDLQLDPADPQDAADDLDRDGLANRDELTERTEMRRSDTDGDGLLDGAEVHLHGTRPTDADTDDGGRQDGAELRSDGTDPLSAADDVLPGKDRELVDGAGYTWRIGDAGYLFAPPSIQQLFDFSFGVNYPSYSLRDAALLDPGERRVTWPELALEGVVVRREAFVSAQHGIVHFVDTLESTSSTNLVMELDYRARYPYSGTRTLATSSGDAVLGEGDAWAVIGNPDDATRGVMVFNLFGSASSARPRYPPYAGSSDVSWRWSVDLPAGKSVSILSFAALRSSQAAAVSAAQEIDALGADVLEGLPRDVRRRSLNFPLFPDADGDGASDAEESAAGSNSSDPDTDGDGLTDGFEIAFALDPLDPSDAALDPDGDGLDGLGEQAAGSDPARADSDRDGLQDGEEDEAGTSPTHWDTDRDGLGDGEERLLVGSSPLAKDTDADGLQDLNELASGTDPASSDTDGDGVADLAEIYDSSLDPNDPTDALADSDADGLTTALELSLGTTRWDADSDDDQLLDGVEHFQTHTDPRAADTDGGGRLDGVEVNDDGTNPLYGLDDRPWGYLPRTLTDGSGFAWPVQDHGYISQGTDNAFDYQALALQIDGNPVYFQTSQALVQLSGRQLVVGPAVHASGLRVSRRVFVPTDDAFVRYLEMFENPGAVARSVRVSIRSDLGSNAQTVEVGTSLEDGHFSAADDWIATDDELDGGGDPVVVHVLSGPRAALEPASAARSTDRVSFDYDLQVPPGGQMALLHFATQRRTRTTALASAAALRSLQGRALAGLGQAELDRVVNFVARIDRDGDGLDDVAELAAGTDPDRADSDADGLGDAWELDADFDPLAAGEAGLDADGDGISNLDEHGLGTDPRLADSDGDGLDDGRERAVDGTDPRNRDSDGDGLGDGEEQLRLRTDPRVVDSDGDGLDDGREVLELHTDPLGIDSDGDTLPDGLETTHYSLSPTDPADGAEDIDQDGLTNADEIARSTDPLEPDSDGDSLADGDEVAAGSDPGSADGDGGGRLDPDEVLRDGTDPADPADDLPARLLPHVLRDASGVDWNFNGVGSVDAPPAPALDEGFALRVGKVGSYTVAIPVQAAAAAELAGRQLRWGPSIHPSLPEIAVTRRAYVPAGDAFVRYVEQIHNRSAAPLTLAVSLQSSLQYFGGTTLATSSGDALLDASDDFAVVSQASTGAAKFVWAFAGARAELRPTFAQMSYYGPEIRYQFTLAPGEAVSLLHFGVQPLAGEDGLRIARDLQLLRGNRVATSAVAGLSQSEQAEIANFFVLPDADGDRLSDAQELLLGTDPQQTDTDGDGLDDFREFSAGLDPLRADRTDDPDGDGLDNDAELAAGTDPRARDTDADGLGDGEEVHVHGSDPLARDRDGDQLLDWEEMRAGTDPHSSDSDGDGLNDRRELGHPPTDPLDPDTDGDGIPDGVEADEYVLDPLDPLDAAGDSDGDGLTELEELVAGSDLRGWDTDYDDLSDGDEVHIHGTDPTKRDSDNGGRSDYYEVRVDLTDPLLASDDVPSAVLPARIRGWDIEVTGEVDEYLDATAERIAIAGRVIAFDSSARREDGGNQLVLGPTPLEIEAGPTLQVTRKVYVSPVESFVRIADVIENPDDEVLRIPVLLGATPCSSCRPSATSSGDLLIGPEDDWVAWQPEYSSSESSGYLFSAANARLQPLAVSTDYGRRIGVEFDVPVPAHGRAIVLSYLLIDRDPIAARLRTASLVDLGGDALTALTPEERADVVNLFAFVDTDRDGLEDASEAAHGTDPADPDSDGDGLTDGYEVNHQLDPLQPADATSDADGDGLDALRESGAGSAPDRRDTDGDGLDDGLEVLLLQSSPTRIDSDGDGLPDGREVLELGADPTLADSDGDQLGDPQELELGTDPVDPDTDGDGIPDGVETWIDPFYTFDPLAPDGLEDPDGDGLDDFAELSIHGTHPGQVDTDGGGREDASEVESRTNPLDPADDLPYLTSSSSLLDGAGRAWSLSSVALSVDGALVATPRQVETSGQEVVVGPIAQGELRITRRLLAPADAAFVRYLELIENRGPATRDVTLQLALQLGSRLLFASSSGDVRSESADDWLAFDDATELGGSLALGWRVAGPGAPLHPTLREGSFSGSSIPPYPGYPSGPTTFRGAAAYFELRLEPGERVAVLHFGVQSALRRGVVLQLQALGDLPDPALQGIDAEDAARVPNFIALPDADRDGLPDATELALGTDPALRDGDGDGLLDGFEVRGGLDPRAADDAQADPDADGLTHVEEQTAGTNPLVADTDRDGLEDGDELERGADPRAADSDADGVMDADELAAGSDPRSPDGDGDGLQDANEIALGTDPSSADTDGDGVGDSVELETSRAMDPLDPSDGLADADADGLIRAQEIVAGTSDVLYDSDYDALSDPDELQRGSNPTRTDTDAGGRSDGQEVLVDGTSPLLESDEIPPAPWNLLLEDGGGMKWSPMNSPIGGSLGSGGGRLLPGGRELLLGPSGDSSGLRVSRRFLVPETGRLVRAVEIYENPTSRRIERRVWIARSLGSGPLLTSLGAQVLTPDDDWIVTRVPELLVHVFSAAGAALEPVTPIFDPLDDWRRSPVSSFDISVPPGGRVLLVHFGALVLFEEDARDAVSRALALEGVGLEGLGDAERAAIVNFPISRDTDRDGLRDPDELASGTDVQTPDSDLDGLLDGFEVDFGLDPLAPDAPAADADGDGLDTAQEQALGTDPRSPDSDGDLLADGAEVLQGTSPRVGDSDGDTLSDSAELQSHATDPLRADTDAGGARDAVEMQDGTSPLDPADDFVEDRYSPYPYSEGRLMDGEGRTWRITYTGDLMPIHSSGYVISQHLGTSIDGQTPIRRVRTQLATGRVRADAAVGQDLVLTRLFDVPAGQPYVRALDRIENRGELPVEIELSYRTSSGGSLLATSSGDAVLSPDDAFQVVGGLSGRVAEIYRSGGPEPEAEETSISTPGGSSYPILVRTWRVSIPAHGGVGLLHFALVGSTTSGAVERARPLLTPDATALSGLDPEQLSNLLNFPGVR